MSKAISARDSNTWTVILVVLCLATLIAAAAMLAFELNSQKRSTALLNQSGGSSTGGGYVSAVQGADRELQRVLSGAGREKAARSPFMPVPPPPRPKKAPKPPPPPPPPVVVALILGGQPQAIVEFKGKEMTVSPNGKVGDWTVTKIDAQGVHLSGRGPDMVLRPR